jgi:hypothetical protein
LLDPTISKETITHPSVDSQVHFYGCAFAVYGFLLWLCANNMTRYASVKKVPMSMFCAAGLARIPALAHDHRRAHSLDERAECFLEETGKVQPGVHRPAALYRVADLPVDFMFPRSLEST